MYRYIDILYIHTHNYISKVINKVLFDLGDVWYAVIKYKNEWKKVWKSLMKCRGKGKTSWGEAILWLIDLILIWCVGQLKLREHIFIFIYLIYIYTHLYI